MRAYEHLSALALLLAAPATREPDLPIVADEAEAAMEILEQRLAGRPVAEESWRHLFSTGGYRRLRSREAAMGRPFDDSTFRAFMMSDTLLRRTAELGRTLDACHRPGFHHPGGHVLLRGAGPLVYRGVEHGGHD